MTVNRFWLAGAALLTDRVVGDPLVPPHPVILMGRYIGWFDRRFNHPGRPGNRRAGMALLVSACLLFGGGAWLLIGGLDRLSPYAGLILNWWLIATTVAWKGLAGAGLDVWHALTEQGLEAGRGAVGRVVGRDTDRLDEAGIVRAGVETLAKTSSTRWWPRSSSRCWGERRRRSRTAPSTRWTPWLAIAPTATAGSAGRRPDATTC